MIEEEVEDARYEESGTGIDIEMIKNGVSPDSFVIVTPEIHYLSDSTKELKLRELEQHLEIDAPKLMRKIDLVVLLPFCFLYFIANLNRMHFGFLWVHGVQMGLGMTGMKFSLATTAFYVPYIFFQSFSNLTLIHVRPHFWISISVFIYGIIIFCTAFTQNFAGFAACEFFHGFFQAGCDSAVFYILGHYYVRAEGQKRINFLYSFSQLSMMVSSLISYAVGKNLGGKNGWESWRWILIIEGCITFGSAIILFFILPDFPEGVRFFSEAETLFIIKKLQIYQGASGYNLKFTVKQILQQLKDPLIFILLIPCSFLGCIFYCFAFSEVFTFTLMGYSGQDSTLRASWTFLAGFGACIVAGVLCDMISNRVIITIFYSILGIIGFAILKYTHASDHREVSYFGSFCITIGSFTVFPLFLGWSFYNLSGHLRRSIITSLMIAFFDIGGLFGIWIIYTDGKTLEGVYKIELIGLIMSIITFFFIFLYVLVIWGCNKKKRTASYKSKFMMLTKTEKIIVGDKAPGFSYTY